MTLRTRIAPTPSGFLHAGNGISFILTYAIARAFDGTILLRIDDLDAERMRPEYVEDIFRTLDWLGLEYNEGPTSPDDFFQNFSQHKRLDIYYNLIGKLQITDLLYECHCSRKQINLTSTNGLYPKTCRNNHLTTHDVHKKETAWRIRVENFTTICFNEWRKEKATIQLDTTMGDFIIRQKNGLPSYQIASLADDELFNINFIVRGNDLLNSTAAQVFLAEQIGHSQFSKNTFYHHPLLKNTPSQRDAFGRRINEGIKLSKSAGATALKEWRAAQRSPLELYRKAAEWLSFPIKTIENIENINDLILFIKNTFDKPF